MTDKPPRSPEATHLEREALATIESYRTFLESPAFQHSIDLAVLVKIAGDDSVDIRERRRAAEVLAKLRLQAMEGLAELTAVREQSLDKLGIKPGGPSVALTQINQKIEIVRAKNWRAAEVLDEGEVVEAEALPTGAEARAIGHESNGHAETREHSDADDPAA